MEFQNKKSVLLWTIYLFSFFTVFKFLYIFKSRKLFKGVSKAINMKLSAFLCTSINNLWRLRISEYVLNDQKHHLFKVPKQK